MSFENQLVVFLAEWPVLLRLKKSLQRLKAETARFELAIRFPAYTLSRRAPSTTRTRLLL